MSDSTSNIVRSIGNADDCTRSLVAVLDRLACGVVIADTAMNVQYVNAMARAWLPDAHRVDELFVGAVFAQPFDGWPAELKRVTSAGDALRWTLTLNPPPRDATPAQLNVTVIPLEREVIATLVAARCSPCVLIQLDDYSRQADLEQQLVVHERLASIGKLAAQVAHELNNPLDGVMRYVNLAGRAQADNQGAKLTSYLEESRKGLLRMMAIVSELLEFSRSTQGEFDDVGINEVVEQAVRAVAARADESRVVIAVDFQRQDLPCARGGKLFQIVSNLLRNAVDAMPDGGRLVVTTGATAEDVIIRVADTGIGLPADPAKVFQPFFTTKPSGKGTGLGLAICKEFVEGMGGRLTAAPGPEKGAAFTVLLPWKSLHPVSRFSSTSSGRRVVSNSHRPTSPSAPTRT